jgi:uracil phosphoribosyltransferase
VLRAGLTFVEGMLDLVPAARMAHIGFIASQRRSLQWNTISMRRLIWPNVWSLSSCRSCNGKHRRGGGRPAQGAGAKDIRLVCLISAGEGIERMRGSIPTSRSGRRQSMMH